MKREGGERTIPLWVWILIALAMLWAGIYYLGFSLPAFLEAGPG